MPQLMEHRRTDLDFVLSLLRVSRFLLGYLPGRRACEAADAREKEGGSLCGSRNGNRVGVNNP